MFERMILRHASVVVVVMAIAAGCRAHGQANAPVNSANDSDDRQDETEPTRASDRNTGSPAAAVEAPDANGGASFLGVVHDLSMAPSVQRTATCRCLSVVYGPPTDRRFSWQAGIPKIDSSAFAIAIAAEGVPCSERRHAPRLASISAVGHEGADIVLVVENVQEGRPVMRGALAVRPGPGGAIVIRARQGAPYGPCRIPVQ